MKEWVSLNQAVCCRQWRHGGMAETAACVPIATLSFAHSNRSCSWTNRASQNNDHLLQSPLQLDVATWLSSGQGDISRSVRCQLPGDSWFSFLHLLCPAAAILDLGAEGCSPGRAEDVRVWSLWACCSQVAISTPITNSQAPYVRERVNLTSCRSHCDSGFFSHS